MYGGHAVNIQRRRFLCLAAGVATLPVATRIARADTYPARPVRIIVATTAGGATDLAARLVAQWLTEKLGQSFFVETVRQQQHRHRGRRPFACRRLHTFHGQFGQYNQRVTVPKAQLQLHRRLRTGGTRRSFTASYDGPSVGSREDGA
jgi:hypothetical protein